MSLEQEQDRIAVIGAGSSGLTAARNLLACGFLPEILERGGDLGGLWNIGSPHGRVYHSTRMISSRKFTQFPDFPMPRDWPDYPHHAQVLEYLRSYADQFDLHRHIRFNSPVERIDRAAGQDGGWRATLSGGAVRHYKAVVLASGHNRHPRRPAFEGRFSGRLMHSAEYRSAEELKGRRVLIVGAGNSGCDIAVEAAQHHAAVSISMRRGYHFIPKYLFGRPVDRLLDKLAALHVPTRVRHALAGAMVRMVSGQPSRLGLPKPDHRLFETHPIINTLLPYYVAHGAVACRTGIARFDGSTVHFTDGTSGQFDVVILATGYELVFPFIDPVHLNWSGGRPQFFLHVFHPTDDTLFAAGMIQPDSGQFGLVHYQAQAIAGFLAAVRDGLPAAQKLREIKRKMSVAPAGVRYADSSRHLLEVEHWGYMKQLQKIGRMLGAGIQGREQRLPGAGAGAGAVTSASPALAR